MAWRSKIRQFISPGQRDGDDDVSIDMVIPSANGNGHQNPDEVGEDDGSVVIPINEERARLGLVKFDGEDQAQAGVREAEKKYREIAAKLQQEIALRMKAEEALRCLKEDLNQSVEIDWKYLEPRLRKAEMEARAREDARERVAKERAALKIDPEGMMVQAQLENERKLRLKAEQSRSEAEAMLLEVEAKIDEAQRQYAEAEARLSEAEAQTRDRTARTERSEEGYNHEIAEIKAEADARVDRAEEKYDAEIVRLRAEAEAKVLEAEAKLRQEENKYKEEIAALKSEVKGAASRIEKNYNTEIVSVRTQAETEIRRLEEMLRAVESEASQAKAELARIAGDANARSNSSGDLEKRIADAETRAKEAEGKILAAVLAREEAESKCTLAEARAKRAEARARGVEPPSAPEDMQQALDYLRRALEADPQNIQAILDLSQVSEAIKHLQATSTLPLPQVEEYDQRQDAAVTPPVKPRTIMAFTHSVAERQMLEEVLGQSGHRIQIASGILDALAKLKEDVPDLVLLDFDAPGMDGYQLCGLIKGIGTIRSVPVVMLSGKQGIFDEVRGRAAGVAGYMTKPLEPADLIKAIVTYCDQAIRK